MDVEMFVEMFVVKIRRCSSNIIYNDILKEIDKDIFTLYHEAREVFLELITVQEELVKVEMLQIETNWPLNERIA